MLSTSRKGAVVRRFAATTVCRVLGGDVDLADKIFQIRHVQDALRAAGQEEHPARAFGRYVEQESSSSTDNTELNRLKTEQQKRQIELQIEDMERKAKIRREEDERQAELKKQEDERQAELKEQEFTAMKEEQVKKHISVMQELTLQEEHTFLIFNF